MAPRGSAERVLRCCSSRLLWGVAFLVACALVYHVKYHTYVHYTSFNVLALNVATTGLQLEGRSTDNSSQQESMQQPFWSIGKAFAIFGPVVITLCCCCCCCCYCVWKYRKKSAECTYMTSTDLQLNELTYSLPDRTSVREQAQRIRIVDAPCIKPDLWGGVSGIVPGMNVIAQTQVVIYNNKAQSFEWKGYGFKLFIPDDALLPGVKSCIITIRVGLSGQFQLPQHYDFISAVYDIRTNTKLAKPITIEIKHCAHCNSPHDGSNLTFATAKSLTSQMELPYKFELLPGGCFTPQSRYGKLSIQHFSIFAILTNFVQWFFTLYYYAQGYYIRKQITDWRVYFIITKDLQTQHEMVRAKYRDRAVDDFDFRIEFDADEIKLGIPPDLQGTTCNGWGITVPYYPIIKKTDVRRSESGVECQICIQWKLKLQEPAELCYTVYLHGAKHPTNFFHVRILDSHLKCASCTCRTSPPPIVPTHKDLMNKVGAVIPAKWRSVGIELGLHPDQLETIEREQNGILAQCFSAVFHKWECDITSPYSWQTIIAVLKAQQVGEKRLAKTLEDHLNAVAIQV